MDNVSPRVRSRIMSQVKTRDTSAEMAVRRIVHGLGYRYALHRKDLPGKPDLVLVGRMKIIFVHGCFWHGHACRYGRLPKSKLGYWRPKIEQNRARDRRAITMLRQEGWAVRVVWQCELKRTETLTKKLARFLSP